MGEPRSEIDILHFDVSIGSQYTFLNFEIKSPDRLLDYSLLPRINLPEGLPRNLGVVFSGKGPVWLYAYLCHLAHPFAWSAVFDPRLGGAVVTARHIKDAPLVGELVKIQQGAK